MYADFEEPIAKVPSHRFLAIRRGENEDVLNAKLDLELEPHLPYARGRIPVRKGSPWQAELEAVVQDALERLLAIAASVDVRVELKLRSDREAIEVFAQNLRELLLAAPLGEKTVLGIDPGQRTGCKCALVDATGKLLEHETIYLVQGDSALEKARDTLRKLCKTHAPRAVAVGNGTHGRETEAFVREVLDRRGPDRSLLRRGERGRRERVFGERRRARGVPRARPDRARRDQHRAAPAGSAGRAREGRSEEHRRRPVPARRVPAALGQKLDEVVESCVNSVGVELNTASAPLLSRVAGIGPTLAKRIVAHRDEHGPFESPQGAARGERPRPAHVRAGRRLSAHARRRASARRERRAPRALRAGRTHGQGPRRAARFGDRQRRAPAPHRSQPLRERTTSASSR